MRDAYEELGRPPARRSRPSRTPSRAVTCSSCTTDRTTAGIRSASTSRRTSCGPATRANCRPSGRSRLPPADWALGRWRELGENRTDLRAAEPAHDLTPAWFEDLAGTSPQTCCDLELGGAEHLLELAHRLASARSRQTDLAHAAAGRPPVVPGQASDRVSRLAVVRRRRPALSGTTPICGCSSPSSTRSPPPPPGSSTTAFWSTASTRSTTRSGRHGCASHGAKPVTLGPNPAERSPVLRSVYDVAFGYPDGDIAKANVAAGTATNDLLRLVLQLPRLADVQDAGGHGRRRLRARSTRC